MSGSELLLPDEMTLRGAGEAIAARMQIEDGVTCERDRIYYDTFDGLVREAGLTLMHADGTLSLASQDSGVVVASLPMRAPTKPLFARDLPPGPLRETLLPITDVRALLALVHLHSHERLLSVLDGERKTVVRLALEETSLVASNGADAALRPRLRITGIRGYDKQLGRVQEQLVAELGFKPADQPLVDEAVRAAGGVPGGLPTKVGVPLRSDQRSDAAAAVVLRAMLEVIEANLEGTIADLDTEFLHDLRVSVRRSRSVQRELKRVFPPDELAHYRAEFRWLQQVTGDVRDLDVHVLEFDDMRALVPEAMRDDLDPLLRVLRARRVDGAPGDGAGAALQADDDAAVGLGLVPRRAGGDAGGRASRTPPVRSAKSPASGSARSTGGCSRWATRSTRRARPRPTTSSARRARSSATCSSCSVCRCSPKRW